MYLLIIFVILNFTSSLTFYFILLKIKNNKTQRAADHSLRTAGMKHICPGKVTFKITLKLLKIVNKFLRKIYCCING